MHIWEVCDNVLFSRSTFVVVFITSQAEKSGHYRKEFTDRFMQL